jgi:glucokinase
VVESFLKEDAVAKNRPEAASLAIAGAVVNNTCDMTNCKWLIDGNGLEKQFGFRSDSGISPDSIPAGL